MLAHAPAMLQVLIGPRDCECDSIDSEVFANSLLRFSMAAATAGSRGLSKRQGRPLPCTSKPPRIAGPGPHQWHQCPANAQNLPAQRLAGHWSLQGKCAPESSPGCPVLCHWDIDGLTRAQLSAGYRRTVYMWHMVSLTAGRSITICKRL